MTLSHKFITLSVTALLLTACGGSKETENHGESADLSAIEQDTIAVTVDDTTKFKFDFAIANIPSPATSMQELGTWGVPYDNSILNNPKNTSKYTTEYQRSINLGVYNIDMAYAMTCDKGPDVLQYMKNILMLSDALGLKGAVDMMVGKRAESNLNSKDSLFKILDEIFVKSDSYLRTNERVYTAATVFAGSWLESLYLTCKISGQLTDPASIEKSHKHLWEQRLHLGNLINLLGDYKDKKECAELIKDLTPINDEIKAIKQPTEMTPDKFNSISSKIYALRNKLTSN
ncbi:hypothetical protein [Aurantibacillus circumpalustris]|uniref:hypothetical protein n=1 Tax=Aurantibacillus circumpalustris TaxID=3036359 RepID=UPI00295AD37C|nr:hypothetical protein [Aurantibacillus circumpalustris]